MGRLGRDNGSGGLCTDVKQLNSFWDFDSKRWANYAILLGRFFQL